MRAATVAANASHQLSFLDEPLARRLAWLRVAATWARRALRAELAPAYPFAAFHARLFLAQARVRAARLTASPRARSRAVRDVLEVFEGRPADWLEHGYAPLLAAEAATAFEWAAEDAEARGESGDSLRDRAIAALDCAIPDELFVKKQDAAFDLAVRRARAWLRRAERTRGASDAETSVESATPVYERALLATGATAFAFEAATIAARASLLLRREAATEAWIDRALQLATAPELDLAARRDVVEAASYLAGEALFDDAAPLDERLARTRRATERLAIDAREAGAAIARRVAYALARGSRAALYRLDRALARARAPAGRALLRTALEGSLSLHAKAVPADAKVVDALLMALGPGDAPPSKSTI